jgi:hypothetical protein
MQLIILYLFAASVGAATENVASCLFQPCRPYLGVYYLVITLEPDLTLYEVATFHADGSFQTIDSLADGNLFSSTPSFGAYSNLNGVWECNGYSKITANVLEFNYPTQEIPRYVSKATYNFQFNGNNQVSGTISYTDYDLASTANSDQSNWIKLAGPFQHNFQGYKLFKKCGN